MARSEAKYQIGEVAERTGLSLRTVRYYEEVGLAVPSARTDGGFRLYTDGDVARLALIRQLKPLDFTLDEVRELLQIRDVLATDQVGDEERAALGERLADYVALAKGRCTKLRERLEQVESVTASLAREARKAKRRSGAAARR